MFENIIGQQQTISQLSRDVQSGELPASVLIHGPQYSGKLSTALELARALTCETGDAAWNCNCRSCFQQRHLLHQETLLLGGRYFLQDIVACGESLKYNRKDASRFLYIRALRKLLRRFDPVLWEGEESKLSKVMEHLSSLQEIAESLTPGPELPTEAKLEKILERALASSGKVCAALVTDNIPVNMVRRATYWAHMTTQAARKVIIIENAEAMQESSRNALLKVLEEPPRGVYFVLTTPRRGAVIATILSRTRSYSLRDRGLDETQSVLERIFRLPAEGCATMRDFFLRMEFSGAADIRLQAHNFIQSVLSAKPDADAIAEVATTLRSAPTRSAFRYFMEELSRQAQEILRNLDGGSGTEPVGESREHHRILGRLEQWNELLREQVTRVEQFNMSADSALETLYYQMRRAG
ncbi:MAG TPA: hypothetical protein VMW73_02220 [Spirochaetia bacterium]|nr:hypothetical protein [Spirochaetia bacterium]